MLNKKITQLACKIAGIENFDTILKDAFAVIFYSNPNEEFLNDYDKIRSCYSKKYGIVLPNSKIQKILTNYFEEKGRNYSLKGENPKSLKELQALDVKQKKQFEAKLNRLRKEYSSFYAKEPKSDKSSIDRKFDDFLKNALPTDEDDYDSGRNANDDSFCKYLLCNDEELFNLFMDISIANSIFSDNKWLNKTSEKDSFSNCFFFLDAPILLKYLGYDGNEYVNLYEKIFKYCKNQNITLKVFQHSVEESWGILYSINIAINQKRFFAKGVSDYLKAKKYYENNGKKDISIVRETFENEIKKNELAVEEKLELTKDSVLYDEGEVKRAFENIFSYNASNFPNRINKDIDSIYAIQSLRCKEGIVSPRTFEDAKYFLLTENKGFVDVSRSFQDKGVYSEILNVNTVVNAMWTDSGEIGISKEMCRLKYLASDVIKAEVRDEIQRICVSLDRMSSNYEILDFIEKNPDEVEKIEDIYKNNKKSVTDVENYIKDAISGKKKEEENNTKVQVEKIKELEKELQKEKNKNSLRPLVSVIIPAYNAERYVESAVRSIMRQTYTNLEILVTDDCSTDGTFTILQKLAEEDSRIKILRNETNLGVVDTLNKLVSETSGVYIARMDADDISLPDRIARQLAFMQQNPQIDFCGCNAFHINEGGKTIGKTTLPESYDDVKFYLPYYSTFYHPTIFARAEVLKQNAYDKDFLHAEDYELWCRLIFAKGMKAENLKERLLKYRINQQGISSRNNQKQMENSARIFDTYNIVPKEFVCFHKNSFFLHKIEKSNAELNYIKSLFRKISKAKMTYSFSAIQKLLFHIYRNYSKVVFAKFVVSPCGLYACLRIFVERIRQNKFNNTKYI